tara:strand:- start:659 stop:1252 length:594 start_codon:yes stop_codon:yes gene_type:complete
MLTVGSRAQVWNGNAKKTSGGLTKKDLFKKKGRIRSRKASKKAKRNQNLKKAGWTFKKGEFGAILIKDKQTAKKTKKKGGGNNTQELVKKKILDKLNRLVPSLGGLSEADILSVKDPLLKRLVGHGKEGKATVADGQPVSKILPLINQYRMLSGKAIISGSKKKGSKRRGSKKKGSKKKGSKKRGSKKKGSKKRKKK